MNTQSKTCPSCDAVNDGDAVFCRCCGKELPKQAQQTPPPYGAYQQNQQTPPPPPPYGTYQQNQQTPPPPPPPYGTYQQNQPIPPIYSTEPPADSYEGDIFGTPAKEVAAYVGRKNTSKFMRDFYDRAATGKKVGFNVPVFLLGLLLGPLYMSFWFFYRKCNKIGAILASIGAVFMIAGICSTIPLINMFCDVVKNVAKYDDKQSNSFSYNYDYDDYFKDFEDYFDSYNDYYNKNYGIENNAYASNSDTVAINGNQYDIYDLGFKPEAAILPLAVLFVTGLASLALAIVCAMYANAWYLKDILRKISEMKQQNPMITADEISRRGGVAYAAWVTILCIAIFISIAYPIGSVAALITAASSALV